MGQEFGQNSARQLFGPMWSQLELPSVYSGLEGQTSHTCLCALVGELEALDSAGSMSLSLYFPRLSMWSPQQSSRTSFMETQGSQGEFSKEQEETARLLKPEPGNGHIVTYTISMVTAAISHFQGRRHKPHFQQKE